MITDKAHVGDGKEKEGEEEKEETDDAEYVGEDSDVYTLSIWPA